MSTLNSLTAEQPWQSRSGAYYGKAVHVVRKNRLGARIKVRLSKESLLSLAHTNRIAAERQQEEVNGNEG